jgi:hypothetical protein
MEKRTRCTHIFRSGPLLPNIRVGGGVAMGQCENMALPLLVRCAEHANSEAIRMAMEELARNQKPKRSKKR